MAEEQIQETKEETKAIEEKQPETKEEKFITNNKLIWNE